MPTYIVHIEQTRKATVRISAENREALEEVMHHGGALGLLLDDLTKETCLVERDTSGEMECLVDEEPDAQLKDNGEFECLHS